MAMGVAATTGAGGAAAGAWRITAAGLDEPVVPLLLLFLAKFGVISKRGRPNPVPVPGMVVPVVLTAFG